jgi:hypothetical protein
MDSDLFDRIAKNLAGRAPRRGAVRAFAAGGLVSIGAGLLKADAIAKKKKKKRCRKFGQTCGGKKKCCKTKGPALCQEFNNFECSGVELSGNRCCGLERAICNPNFGEPSGDGVGNCSCCAPLFCGQQPGGKFRCQTEDT